MSTDSAITVEKLGKCYRIGLAEKRAANLREAIIRAVRTPFRYLESRLRTANEEELVWALRDVSFEIARGEVLGIIGKNGAGKSTLLKILSRITDPSEGRAQIRGRVNSLLEVGTGFHPELTGRENIYMNAAMHGMRRAEIKRKIDAIIEFAENGKFADTPVKRYSSGMYMRLAFAVAAHLEPDILIVDEVLAVGDAAFQRKCIGKMSSVAKEGRTVLFVSHNMQAISALCRRSVLLEKGRVKEVGETQPIVERYLEAQITEATEVEWPLGSAPGNDVARLLSVRVLDKAGVKAYDHSITEPITLEIRFAVLQPDTDINASFHVYNEQGTCLFAVGTNYNPEWSRQRCGRGLYTGRCTIPANFLNEGAHQVSALVVQDQLNIVARADAVVGFHAHDYGMMRGDFTGKWIGAVRPLLAWEMKRSEESP